MQQKYTLPITQALVSSTISRFHIEISQGKVDRFFCLWFVKGERENDHTGSPGDGQETLVD